MVALKHGLLGFACGFGTSPHLMTLPSTRLTMVPTKASAAECLSARASALTSMRQQAGRQAGTHAHSAISAREQIFFFGLAVNGLKKSGNQKTKTLDLERPRAASKQARTQRVCK